jgi:hypothetical protein
LNAGVLEEEENLLDGDEGMKTGAHPSSPSAEFITSVPH